MATLDLVHRWFMDGGWREKLEVVVEVAGLEVWKYGMDNEIYVHDKLLSPLKDKPTRTLETADRIWNGNVQPFGPGNWKVAPVVTD